MEFHPIRCNIDGWPIADLVVDEIPGCRDELGPDGLAGTGDEDFRSTSCSEGIDQGDQNLLPADRADIDGDGTAMQTWGYKKSTTAGAAGTNTPVHTCATTTVDTVTPCSATDGSSVF